ncbi:hypothetical protein [Echinicola salinicaeni]|uniref:hypothetical protein n=1 Tax=Echinicola salinicaeni TaxID=2762757 RepID=UPI001647BFBC|nr:hypothetical protein [Echinicola salinicaeni]
MKPSLFIVLFLAVLFSACTDDDRPLLKAEGMVKDTGDPAVDGCGWLIEINGENYKPKSLKDQYKIDGLEVLVYYNLSGVSYCGMGNTEITLISIESIEEK